MFTAASQNISNVEIVSGGTNFGIIVASGTSDQKLVVAKALGVSCARTSITLKDFRGKADMVEKYNSAGIKVLLNLNYAQVTNNNPNPFPKDMVEYRKLLGDVLSKYKPEVAVIENEPTTQKFHSGPIEDYIAMLKVAVEVCHQYGVKVADGAIHAVYIQQIMNGSRLQGNAVSVNKMIQAYKTIPLDYINVHTKGSGDSYPAGQLKAVADYLRATTGKQVMSNEFHLENNSTSLMQSFIKEWGLGNYTYAVVYSSNSGKNAPLSNGTTLTSLGVTYRDKIN